MKLKPQLLPLNPSEQRGLFVLLLLIVVLFIVRSLPGKQVFYDLNYYTIRPDSIEKLQGVVMKFHLQSDLPVFAPTTRLEMNHLSASDMRDYGFPKHWIDAVFTYKRNSGFVRSEEDLKLLCGSDSNMFYTLRPVVYYKYARDSVGHESKRSFKGLAKQTFDINRARAEEWAELPGIGPVLAKRILRFSESLGGFYSVHQIGEVYGIDSALLVRLLPRLVCSGEVKKIAVNSVDAASLEKHPYISRKQAATLVQYRTQHGNFTDISSLEPLALWDPATRRKIEPYLDFSPD